MLPKTKNKAVALFKGKKVRRVWDEESERQLLMKKQQ
jgi:hypothetical protein